MDSSISRGASAFAMAVALVWACAVTSANAEEPQGCASFKWPVQQEAALLQGKDLSVARPTEQATIGTAYTMNLVDLDQAHLPHPPSRTPKDGSRKAGFISFAAPSSPGTLQITISEAAWIDVLQDGRLLKSAAFSGATGCPGVRKTIRFAVEANPYLVEISGTRSDTLALVAEVAAAKP